MPPFAFSVVSSVPRSVGRSFFFFSNSVEGGAGAEGPPSPRDPVPSTFDRRKGVVVAEIVQGSDSNILRLFQQPWCSRVREKNKTFGIETCRRYTIINDHESDVDEDDDEFRERIG